jgi:hypothetical protein
MKTFVQTLILVLLINLICCVNYEKNLKNENTSNLKNAVGKMETVEGNNYQVNLQLQTELQLQKEKKVVFFNFRNMI